MKGQYFSFDAIIASVIFVLALVALLSYWHSVRSFLDFQNDQLTKDAIRVSNLMFTPPSPDTTCGTMDHLGFSVAWDDRRVNESVIECAKIQSPSWIKEKFGTPFGTSIKVTKVDDESNVTVIGGDVPSNAMNVVNIRRLATVVNATGGTYLAKFDLSVYR
ncbi:MAG TPA: hypothetical protein VLD37_04785 [Candidatus Bilamarchaeum sp.]|nr:hypothetical protein [Candidatus Bilamarchaeum sp.]